MGQQESRKRFSHLRRRPFVLLWGVDGRGFLDRAQPRCPETQKQIQNSARNEVVARLGQNIHSPRGGQRLPLLARPGLDFLLRDSESQVGGTIVWRAGRVNAPVV